MNMDENTTVSVKCTKCKTVLQPDMSSPSWLCPNCQHKNPNLRRHYRSVADVCILSFIAEMIFMVIVISDRGANWGTIFLMGHAIILLVTIIKIYMAKTPWTDTIANTLIWIVVGLGILNPLCLFIVLPYVIWLNIAAKNMKVSTNTA
jgi:predicted RNA-binding Zn-ribbon protein involved in translation (DUF1610 family)